MIKRGFLFGIISPLYFLLLSYNVHAQFPIVSAEQVKQWLDTGRKFAIIDSRTLDEYLEGHIPGAISIPAEHMKIKKTKLPKDKSTLLVFYCRGAG